MESSGDSLVTSLTPARASWRTTRTACGHASGATVCQPSRSRDICQLSATQRRWRSRWRGYRAQGVRPAPVGPTKVPTLFIWGHRDGAVGRAAAEATGEFITAPYQFEVLPGVGYYTADQVPAKINALVLAYTPLTPESENPWTR